MSTPLGMEMKAYYDPSGVNQSAWHEIPIAKEARFRLTKTLAEITSRDSEWRKKKGALKELSIDMTILRDVADDAVSDLYSAFVNDTTIGIALMDGAIATNGSEGLTADMKVASYEEGEPLEEGATIAVTFELAYAGTDPAWLAVAVS